MAAGKEKVGVAEIVGDGVMVGVNVAVGVEVLVGVRVEVAVKVDVGVGVFVHASDVAVAAEEVNFTCSSADGPHAVRNRSMMNISLNNFI